MSNINPTYLYWASRLVVDIAENFGHKNVVPVERPEWLIAWAQKENTKARFNPLATTLSMPGSLRFNSAGVRDYKTLADGVKAVVETLEYGSGRGYSEIIEELLKPDTTFEKFRSAVSRSAWSGEPRDGKHYLIPNYDPEWRNRTLPV